MDQPFLGTSLVPFLLGVIAALLAGAVFFWARYFVGMRGLRQQVANLEETMQTLRKAVLDEAAEEHDHLMVLRESKHYTEGWRHLIERLLDELHVRLGLPIIEWEDREEARQKYFDIHRANQD